MSPNHHGQCCGSRMTGILSSGFTIIALVFVSVRCTIPSGHLYPPRKLTTNCIYLPDRWDIACGSSDGMLPVGQESLSTPSIGEPWTPPDCALWSLACDNHRW
jgi:hypothetical protein